MEKKGWVSKKSKWLGNWRNRYCQIVVGSSTTRAADVFFSKTESTRPHISFNLIDVKSVISVAPERYGKLNVYEVQLRNGSSISVCVGSDAIRQDWMAAISAGIVQRPAPQVAERTPPKLTAAQSEAICAKMFHYTIGKDVVRVPMVYNPADAQIYTFTLNERNQKVLYARVPQQVLTSQQKQTLKSPELKGRCFVTHTVS